MARDYKCRICGCRLDAGEGDLCDECAEANKTPSEALVSSDEIEATLANILESESNRIKNSGGTNE